MYTAQLNAHCFCSVFCLTFLWHRCPPPHPSPQRQCQRVQTSPSHYHHRHHEHQHHHQLFVFVVDTVCLCDCDCAALLFLAAAFFARSWLVRFLVVSVCTALLISSHLFTLRTATTASTKKEEGQRYVPFLFSLFVFISFIHFILFCENSAREALDCTNLPPIICVLFWCLFLSFFPSCFAFYCHYSDFPSLR